MILTDFCEVMLVQKGVYQHHRTTRSASICTNLRRFTIAAKAPMLDSLNTKFAAILPWHNFIRTHKTCKKILRFLQKTDDFSVFFCFLLSFLSVHIKGESHSNKISLPAKVQFYSFDNILFVSGMTIVS